MGVALSSSPSSSVPPAPATRGCVLVVDDEDVIRASLRRLLKGLGFDVVLAADGDEALALFSAEPARYCLVFLDLTMPKRSGAEIFRELKKLSPDVRVLLMSGFHHTEATAQFSPADLRGFLAKPFDRASLATAMQFALGESE